MSDETPINPLSFEFGTRRNRTRESESSEAVSPTTSVRSQAQHSGKSPGRHIERRPSMGPRSKSEQPPRTKFNVQTIEEGIVHIVNQTDQNKQNSIKHENFSEGLRQERSSSSAKTDDSSQSRINQRGKFVPKLQRPALKRATNDRGTLKSTQRISWSRSSSGIVRTEKQRSSTPNDDSSSTRSYFSRPVTIQHPSTSILPLKPPPRSEPATPQSQHDHKVKMETSFTNLRHEPNPATFTSTVGRSKSHLGSINPLLIFSAPLTGLRRFSRSKRKSGSVSTARRPQRISPSEARDHQSMLKREQTGAVLNRVSTLLECMKAPKIKALDFRSLSERSESSQNSKVLNGARNSMPHEPAPLDLSVRNSGVGVNDRRSYSSSLVKLRMGPTPSNTINERATYKIKRSQSAETEEFPKIDISVRGCTSYLPSEARRIHTPPLPEDGPKGMRRGFFFDYNAPRLNEGTGGQASLNYPTKSEHGLVNKRNDSVVERNLTIGKRHTQQLSRKGLRAKAGDWYDAQLAELDGSSDEEEFVALPVQLSRRSSKSLTGAKRLKDEQLLDYNIPEHLPSSPLCPRNPKYWRVVKGKGSQFRGCWMHGFGEYE